MATMHITFERMNYIIEIPSQLSSSNRLFTSLSAILLTN